MAAEIMLGAVVMAWAISAIINQKREQERLRQISRALQLASDVGVHGRSADRDEQMFDIMSRLPEGTAGLWQALYLSKTVRYLER